MAGVAGLFLVAVVVSVVTSDDPWLWGGGLLLAVAAGVGLRRWALRLRARWVLARTDMRRVDRMSGVEFEWFVADLMRDSGYRKVTVVGQAGDGGVDIRAETPDGRPCVVQCKRRNRPVQPNDVRAFLGVLHSSHQGYRGIFVASNGFTQQATREAAQQMTLVDRAAVALWLTKRESPQLSGGD